MSKKDMIKHFLFSSDIKEILAAHLFIVLLSSIVYTISEFYAVVAFVSLMFLELIMFHILWIYRDNPQKENRLKYSLKQEFINIIIGGTGAFILLALITVLSKITKIALLFPFILVSVILFILYSVYRTNKIFNKIT